MSQERINEIDVLLDRYKEAITVIDAFRKERATLVKKIKDEEKAKRPFEEKFKEFFESGKGKILSDLADLKYTLPKFYARYIEPRNIHFDRYKTYKILDRFGDDFYAIFEKETKRYMKLEYATEEKFQKEFNEILECAEEIYTEQVAGWVYYW